MAPAEGRRRGHRGDGAEDGIGLDPDPIERKGARGRRGGSAAICPHIFGAWGDKGEGEVGRPGGLVVQLGHGPVGEGASLFYYFFAFSFSFIYFCLFFLLTLNLNLEPTLNQRELNTVIAVTWYY